MNPILINITLPVLISLIFSSVIFIYLFSFNNKKSHLNIYTHLFLSFTFSGIFLSLFNKNNVPAKIIISFSFILFLTLILTTYKEYGRKLDFYYFSLIVFYSLNFFLLLIKSLFINSRKLTLESRDKLFAYSYFCFCSFFPYLKTSSQQIDIIQLF